MSSLCARYHAKYDAALFSLQTVPEQGRPGGPGAGGRGGDTIGGGGVGARDPRAYMLQNPRNC